MPKRIQRRRTKGWKMPPNTVAVTRPTSWGNPFRVGHYYRRGVDPFIYLESYAPEPGYTKIRDAAEAVAWFRWYIERSVKKIESVISDLKDKDLACWCKEGEPCHADVLLEIANS